MNPNVSLETIFVAARVVETQLAATLRGAIASVESWDPKSLTDDDRLAIRNALEVIGRRIGRL